MRRTLGSSQVQSLTLKVCNVLELRILSGVLLRRGTLILVSIWDFLIADPAVNVCLVFVSE